MARRGPGRLVMVGIATWLLLPASAPAEAGRTGEEYRARLSGFDETPQTLSTAAKGRFRAALNRARTTIEYELQYDGFTSDVVQAHIHLGKPGLSGGVVLFLCGRDRTDAPACPARAGTVTGTLRAGNVIGPADQGFVAGQLPQLLEAIRAGAAYVNVHSTTRPGGEIRGPLRVIRD